MTISATLFKWENHMGPDFLAAFLILLLTISGGSAPNGQRTDLLDLIPTASYWRTKAVTVSREQLEADIGPAAVPQDLARLVKDLESLSRRDAAKKQLAAIGAPALDLLHAATS